MPDPSATCHVCEIELPPLEAALACALILMTAHQRTSISEAERRELACKIAAQLQTLAVSPLTSPAFHHVAHCLRSQWQGPHVPAHPTSTEIQPATLLWHSPPERLQ